MTTFFERNEAAISQKYKHHERSKIFSSRHRLQTSFDV